MAAAVTLPLGLTRGKEYAELIWPVNLAVVVIWVVFAVNFFWTLARRNEPSLYVAIWFYIATIVTVAMLYIVNHLSLPTSLLHSYPVFGGVQDALVQWWYGHNAVAFFLTTPILGIMYYFLPKAAERPVYSYRLSVIHFWSLVFVYIWTGPHHLLNTALPGWLQALGMTFSLMLWAPSWGGMLNGLLNLVGLFATIACVILAIAHYQARARQWGDWYDRRLVLWQMSRNAAFVNVGKATFTTTCATCHKPDLTGGIGPNLVDQQWIHGGKPSEIYQTVSSGVSAKGMPIWGPVLGAKKITALVAYILSYHAPGEPVVIVPSPTPGGAAVPPAP